MRNFEEAGYEIGAVSTAYKLCDAPLFIASSDSAWWRAYHDVPDCRHYSMCPTYLAQFDRRVAVVRMQGMGVVNSGVLALEMAKRHGYKNIYLYGFDMHGSHFFGSYTNGLRNTNMKQREVHAKQYARWAENNPHLNVVNITEDSALTCFPRGELCRS